MPSLLLLLSGCAVTTLMSQGRSLPQIDGAATGPGLAGEVQILRDSKGIPHVRAGSESDATYGIGFVHGQDRAFQMDLMRRIAYGRVSEVLGPDFAELDAFMRAMDLQKRAEDGLRAMDPDTRFQLAAYAQGVNAGFQTAKKDPIEYRLLKVEGGFADWTAADSMAVIFMQSLGLGSGHWQELVSWQLREKLDRDDLDALWVRDGSPRVDPYWAQVQKMEAGGFTPEFQGFVDFFMAKGTDTEASNAWVVGAERSKGEAPIVANDPHLPVRVPGIWYIVEAKGGDLHVAGGTMPGMPWVISGHNEHMAWGMTNLMADYLDYAIVQRKGDGYILAGQQKAFQAQEFTIELPEGERSVHTVQMTELGPVLTELEGDHVLVMQWSAFHHPDQSAALLKMLNHSETVEAFVASERPPTLVGLNLVLGDDQGSIGYQSLGILPQRKGHTGRVPYPASSEYHGWDGWIEAMPGLMDPEGGVIVSANTKAPQTDASVDPYKLGTFYFSPWRKHRIEDLIQETPQHSVATMGKVQMDTLDTHAQARVPEWVVHLEPQSEGGQWVRDVLAGWDYSTDPRSVESLVWAELQKQMVLMALEEKGLSGHEIDLVLRTSSPGRSLLDTDTGMDHFFADADKSTRAAMLRAYDALVAQYGEDTSAWSWGDAHAVTFAHPFGVKVLNAGSTEYGGSSNTVNVSSFNWAQGYETKWIASLRVVTPLNDVGQAVVVLPPGQSGHPASRHYQDQLHSWKTGGTLPLYFHDEDVERAADSTLTLTP
ncbi:MAG: penicillin acylase family protein [Myxococcota bacterium]|nr:penicillin acylase family protein [Myxococcota bacterium]